MFQYKLCKTKTGVLLYFVQCAGGNTEELGSIDGVDLWEELSNDLPSERQEIVYNIDTAGNHSAIRHGNYKLFLGTSYYGYYEDRYDVPGGTRPQDDLDNLMEESRAAKVLKEFHGTQHFEYTPGWRKKAAVDCGNETSNFMPRSPPYLFDLERDPCELTNLAETRPQVSRIIPRGPSYSLSWNITLQPSLYKDSLKKRLRCNEGQSYTPPQIPESL